LLDKALITKVNFFSGVGFCDRYAQPEAIASNIQPRSPLWFHEELEKATKQGWILSSSEVEALIGVKPK
jgi:hypothetical protein